MRILKDFKVPNFKFPKIKMKNIKKLINIVRKNKINIQTINCTK